MVKTVHFGAVASRPRSCPRCSKSNDTEGLRGLGLVNRAFIVKYVRQIDLLR